MTADVFSDVLELHDAAMLRDAVAQGLETSSPYILDLSHVQRASLGCVQVLVSALRADEAREKKLTISLSEPLKEALIDLGLERYAE